jgi:Flp pilus assembly protein TadB
MHRYIRLILGSRTQQEEAADGGALYRCITVLVGVAAIATLLAAQACGWLYVPVGLLAALALWRSRRIF